ncbi:MAG: hypothetical protein EOM11_03435 [Erysipelotrichia bacterium]|nr:hypothetical protein [Erysipelotrichia bacterium]
MKSKMYEIQCSKCESIWAIKCESVVHAENEKSLKKLILEEAFFTRKCSKCGELMTFYYPFLYCDLKRKFLIALIVDEETSWIKELDELEIYHHFHKRIVYNEKQLKEKILIYEFGLLDEGIEQIKERLKNKYEQVYFESADDDLLWFESEKGPIGVERRFYQMIDSGAERFIHI